MKEKHIKSFDKAIFKIFRKLLSIMWRWPRYFIFMIRTIFRQNKAAGLRSAYLKSGIHVPPFAIMSITSQCNLNCTGCYAKKIQNRAEREMSSLEFKGVLNEASELGFSIIILAGGEPLTRRDVFKITELYPKMIFLMFTNGILLHSYSIRKINKNKNLIPVLSIEGDKKLTDKRRGPGIHSELLKTADKLRKEKTFFGVSITITRENYGLVTNDNFIKHIIDSGAGLVFFISYIPVKKKTENLVLSDSQNESLSGLTTKLNKKYPAVFVAFPGDEEQFGGCLSSGRGFIHINSEGRVEPCPFAPVSDSSLREISLKQALSSKLLKTIRNNHDNFSSSESGCTLWDNRELVKSIIESESI